MAQAGNPGSKKPRKKQLPPEVLAAARALSGKWGVPIQTAVQVAKGNARLEDVLLKMQLKEKVARLVRDGQLFAPLGPQVAAGSWSLEDALFATRLRQRKHAPDYMRCLLDDYARDGRATALALVGRRLLQGKVLESRTFDLTFLTNEEEELVIAKHDLKFYFGASRRKHLLKAIRWGSADEAVEPDRLKAVGSRVDIKARILLALQESERAVDWQTVERDTLRGKLAWFGRFEANLQTPRGDIVVLRHAVSSIE